MTGEPEADELIAEVIEIQARVARGEIDLRPVGQLLTGKWDQDFPAELLEAARAESLKQRVAALEWALSRVKRSGEHSRRNAKNEFSDVVIASSAYDAVLEVLRPAETGEPK